jgi:glycosyltransferase involved in cell wall biosynthesis
MTISLSLIVTTYEWPKALNLTLRSIARQTELPDEIIIADDGSGPETTSLIHQWRRNLATPLHHVWQPHEGFRLARSRNAALAKARGEYVVFVDGDMVLHPNFVEDHRQLAQPGFFIQGCRLLTRAAAAQRMFDKGELDLGFFAPGIERRHHAVRSSLLSRLFSKVRTDLTAIRGCNQGYWRWDLVRTNGFNERMVGWGREDNELAARLHQLGLVRRNVKFKALATHLYHPRRHPRGENPNDAILRETIERKHTRCREGLDMHIAARVQPPVLAAAWRAYERKVAGLLDAS